MHGFPGYFDLDAMIFGGPDASDDIKWKLLLWSLGLDFQLKFDLQKLPKENVLMVLVLLFLLKVKFHCTSFDMSLSLKKH